MNGNLVYREAVGRLKERIINLIPAHPEILDIDDCWDLFEIDGFVCDDISPSLAQAQSALSAAQAQHRDQAV